MCAGTLHSYRDLLFPGYGTSQVCHVSDLILNSLPLLLSMASIKLSVSVYIRHLVSTLFYISLIAIYIVVISAVWMDVSSDSAPLLVMCTNTAAEHTFLPVLLDPSV